MIRTATDELYGAVAIATVSLFGAILLGRVELVAVGAPFILALVTGLAAWRDPDIAVGVSCERDRCLEGESLGVTVTLTADEDVDEVYVALRLPPGFRDPRGTARRVVSLEAGRDRVLEVGLEAERWGVYRVGTVGLRVVGRGGFVRSEKVRDVSRPVKVFPAVEKLRRGLRPPHTGIFSGNYPSRASGDGIEFAQVRPFERGDRVRSVNWRVTSRRGELHVNVFHPERDADVVVFLDSFGDFGPEECGSLEVAVRGACGVARHFLQQRDRVGIVSFGGIVRWLRTGMGNTQVVRAVDVLLESRALFSYAWKDIELLPRGVLPPGALVLAFSPLVDRRAVGALLDIHGRGFPMVVVDTLDEAGIPPAGGAEGELAHRVWRLRRSVLRADLATSGVPVVVWDGRGSLDGLLSSIPPIPAFRRAAR